MSYDQFNTSPCLWLVKFVDYFILLSGSILTRHNVYFCDELPTTYGATASLRNDMIFTICSRTSKEFCDSFTASVEMPHERAVLKKVVVRRIHFVTLSGVVYVTVVKRSVTGALKRHTIHTTHLGIKANAVWKSDQILRRKWLEITFPVALPTQELFCERGT